MSKCKFRKNDNESPPNQNLHHGNKVVGNDKYELEKKKGLKRTSKFPR